MTPVCSYGGTTQVTTPAPAKSTSIPLEPTCRYVDGTSQTATPDVAE